MGEGERFYLRGLPQGLLLLDKEKSYTIGRLATNSIVLANTAVSRHHGRLEWRRAGFCLDDLGSANGTYVNNVRITTTQLMPNDLIGIGPFEMLFVEGDPDMDAAGVEADTEDDLTVPFVLSGSEARTSRRAKSEVIPLKGRLADTAIAELLQFMEFNNKSGTLKIATPTGSGFVYIGDGDILDATFNRLEGLPAVDAILSQTEGEFKLISPEFPQRERKIDMPTTAILLDYLREFDEQQKEAREQEDKE